MTTKTARISMLRRLLPALLLAALALAIAAPSALAANGQNVIDDWKQDSSIDGSYTLADLRAANAMVSSEEREYYNWDEAYAATVRHLAHPDAPVKKPLPTVIPVDANGNGTIDPSEKATAAEATEQLRAKQGLDTQPPSAEPRDKDNKAAAAAGTDDSSGGDGGFSWLLALLVAIPAAIIAVGVWRMQRARNAGKRAPGDDLT